MIDRIDGGESLVKTSDFGADVISALITLCHVFLMKVGSSCFYTVVGVDGSISFKTKL